MLSKGVQEYWVGVGRSAGFVRGSVVDRRWGVDWIGEAMDYSMPPQMTIYVVTVVQLFGRTHG